MPATTSPPCRDCPYIRGSVLAHKCLRQRRARGKYLVYVGTYTDHGSKGIYAYRFDARTGQSTALGLAAEAGAVLSHRRSEVDHFLYAVNETESYQGQPTGAVSAFAIDPASGKLLY